MSMLLVPLAFTAGLLALTVLPRLHATQALLWSFWGAGGVLLAWLAVIALGANWLTKGDGKWEWGDDDQTLLRQTEKPTSASCLNTTVTGARGTWRCAVKAPDGTTAAGLLFQVNKELTEGFALLLTPQGARLLDLGQKGRVLWESDKAKLTAGTPFVLEGLVQTDRLVARVLSADGKTVIVESPPVYVSDKNNEREGCLGVRTEGGVAEFPSWSLADDE